VVVTCSKADRASPAVKREPTLSCSIVSLKEIAFVYLGGRRVDV
jgi:hypothetical protein